ncbi:MAG TPA: ketoacyl-ACP synthase III [Thermoanaerobaculia bacterium]
MQRDPRPARTASVRAITYYLPEQQLDNQRLASELGDWTAEKILEKTGIACRSIAAPDECSSDLGVAAAEALFESGVCAREEIDFLLFCTQSPDYFLPATACIVQDRLGLRTDCGALDFNQGCSGFVYGLALAKSLVEGLGLRNVLLITAETYSKFIHPRDRSVRTIFGDAAAATLIQASSAAEEMIGPFVFGTDGRGAANLIVPAGGMRKPMSEETSVVSIDEGGNERSENHLFMNGPEIFSFTLKAVPAAVNGLLARAEIAPGDVDYFILHQANRFMLEKLRAKMKIDPERFCVELESCGNTVSSTIPIALARSLADGRLKSGDLVMGVGFGVGYSWAAGMIRVPQEGI